GEDTYLPRYFVPEGTDIYTAVLIRAYYLLRVSKTSSSLLLLEYGTFIDMNNDNEPGLYPNTNGTAPSKATTDFSGQPGAVTPLGLRQPPVLDAIGPLRADSALPDVVLIDVSARIVYTYLAKGDGTLAVPTSFTLGVSGATLTAVGIGDANGDGKPDIVLTDAAHNSVIVL